MPHNSAESFTESTSIVEDQSLSKNKHASFASPVEESSPAEPHVPGKYSIPKSDAAAKTEADETKVKGGSDTDTTLLTCCFAAGLEFFNCISSCPKLFAACGIKEPSGFH